MFHINSVIRCLEVISLFIPLTLAIISVTTESTVIGVISLAVIFLLATFISFIHGNESVWIFVLTAIATIPINIKIVSVVVNEFLTKEDFIIIQIPRVIMVYAIIFCIEETAMGYISRIFWRRQKKIDL